MKIIKTLAALLLTALFLTSCSDTHEAVMRDQTAWLKQATVILNEVADEKITPEKAAGRIKELGKESKEIAERRRALSANATPEELAATKPFADQVEHSFQEYLDAVKRVTEAGKMNEELTKALENIDTM